MTKWKALPIAVVLSVIVFCGYLFAQTQPPPPRGGRDAGQDPRMEQAIDMMYQEMDTNHDGKISKKEWMAAQERHFNQLDKNGDGFITKDEVRSDMMERMRSMQPPPPQGGRAPQPQ